MGAGNLVSNLDDLTRFFGALLGGRLLPPRLLAAMMTPVPTSPPGFFRYGLGLMVPELPFGRLAGHDGDIPGFSNIVFSTQDGRRQFGIMLNEHYAPPAVSDAFYQALFTIAMGLLEGTPLDVAPASATPRAAVGAGAPAAAARALERVLAGMAVGMQH